MDGLVPPGKYPRMDDIKRAGQGGFQRRRHLRSFGVGEGTEGEQRELRAVLFEERLRDKKYATEHLIVSLVAATLIIRFRFVIDQSERQRAAGGSHCHSGHVLQRIDRQKRPFRQ